MTTTATTNPECINCDAPVEREGQDCGQCSSETPSWKFRDAASNTTAGDATEPSHKPTCARFVRAPTLDCDCGLHTSASPSPSTPSDRGEATARPWRLSAAQTAIAGDDDTKVADCNIGWHKDTATANANAALIVQAVNSFDARDAFIRMVAKLAQTAFGDDETLDDVIRQAQALADAT